MSEKLADILARKKAARAAAANDNNPIVAPDRANSSGSPLGRRSQSGGARKCIPPCSFFVLLPVRDEELGESGVRFGEIGKEVIVQAVGWRSYFA